jgi:competence protein ComEC
VADREVASAFAGDFGQHWAHLANAARARLHVWLLQERASGRLAPWLPVAFGAGVALYFAAGREPVLWAVLGLFMAASLIAFLCRRKTLAFTLVMLCAAACAGFACATTKAALIGHPVLKYTVTGAEVTGWVERREERERTDRITIAVHGIEARRMEEPLQRVRVTVRKGMAPPIGTFIAFKARLNPPLAPLRPGGYDFARDLYFQRIGATGFVLGEIKRPQAPAAIPRYLRAKAAVASVRDAIDLRIRSLIPGDAGAIASALITGKRDAISTQTNEAMYVSSLAHVLSISGYHMALVAGVVFFAVRGLLALSSNLAIRRPIKKWASGAALAAATGYLLLSGAEIATQRAYIMTTVVLVGVMLDRPALTLRTLALAAFAILLFAPDALVHPGFQMSFAATLALVAVYERGLPWMHGGADTSAGARVALWGGRAIVALIIASAIAGLATTLYAAYHFHRLAPYGVLANLLAMPIVSLVIMPAGLLALALLPFGLDAWLWQVMGTGIEWMIAVALMIAQLPGAVGRIAAFPMQTLLLGTAALLVICLLRSPLRWSGLALALLAIGLAWKAPLPDILIANEADAVAVRSPSGRLTATRLGSDSYSIRERLAADGDERSPTDRSLSLGTICDAEGCTLPLRTGGIVAIAQTADAFADDCARAALIVTRRQAPPGCAALVIDRDVWRDTGALSLYRTKTGFSIERTRPQGYDHPWSPAPQAARTAGTPATTAPASNATPRPDDLRPDD